MNTYKVTYYFPLNGYTMTDVVEAHNEEEAIVKIKACGLLLNIRSVTEIMRTV